MELLVELVLQVEESYKFFYVVNAISSQQIYLLTAMEKECAPWSKHRIHLLLYL